MDEAAPAPYRGDLQQVGAVIAARDETGPVYLRTRDPVINLAFDASELRELVKLLDVAEAIHSVERGFATGTYFAGGRWRRGVWAGKLLKFGSLGRCRIEFCGAEFTDGGLGFILEHDYGENMGKSYAVYGVVLAIPQGFGVYESGEEYR